MSEHTDDERGRADRLLEADFLDRLTDLDSGSLLTARDDAVEEEDQISYVRRLLQGRLDLLNFEKERRASGQGTQPELGTAEGDRALARRLGKVLTAPPTGVLRLVRADASAGAATVSVAEHRRAAEAAAGDVRLSDPKALDDAALDAALERIAVFESGVSVNRRRLQIVADALLAEVARRVEAGALPAEEIPAGQHGDTPSLPATPP
jgi:hypothetical protein